MKTKLNQTLTAAVFMILSVWAPLAFSQTPTASPSIPLQGQMQGMNQPQQMGGMDKMSDAVTKAAQACESMMKKEMAAMAYKVSAIVTIVILLIVALALLIVLEIQWIKYWSRILKRPESSSGGDA